MNYQNVKMQFPTPAYIFLPAEFHRSVRGFQQALASRFPLSRVAISVKTNSLPALLRQARSLGVMAEVVSYDEYNLARLCGFTPPEIIYNGPMKSRETFLEAVAGGAVVNIETHREILWLNELPRDGRTYPIGLRLNINISRVSPEDADGPDDNSRFGFCDASGEFYNAISQIRALPHVRLVGLHIHRTVHSRSPRFYARSTAFAASIIQKYNLQLRYLDIGGGYYGIFHNKPTYQDYAAAIASALPQNLRETLTILVEPGNALVASCFQFLTTVIDTKIVDNGTVFVTTDGSRNDLDPFFRKNTYLFEILPREKDTGAPTVPEQTVTGCTCLETDRLFTLKNHPRLRPGDQILYNNVGAYTMSLTPQLHPPQTSCLRRPTRRLLSYHPGKLSLSILN